MPVASPPVGARPVPTISPPPSSNSRRTAQSSPDGSSDGRAGSAGVGADGKRQMLSRNLNGTCKSYVFFYQNNIFSFKTLDLKWLSDAQVEFIHMRAQRFVKSVKPWIITTNTFSIIILKLGKLNFLNNRAIFLLYFLLSVKNNPKIIFINYNNKTKQKMLLWISNDLYLSKKLVNNLVLCLKIEKVRK